MTLLRKRLREELVLYGCAGFGPLAIALLAQLIYITGPGASNATDFLDFLVITTIFLAGAGVYILGALAFVRIVGGRPS